MEILCLCVRKLYIGRMIIPLKSIYRFNVVEDKGVRITKTTWKRRTMLEDSHYWICRLMM